MTQSFLVTDALRDLVTRNVGLFPSRNQPGEGLKHAAVALVVVANEAGEGALLLTRRAPRLNAHAGQWALPGGRLDKGETPIDAALREMHEEVVVAAWIASPEISVILTTGGTGVTGRDGTPEAIGVLLDKQLEGFGEMFRVLSFAQINTSTLQSRALAGVANATYVFCLPGSPSACILAWDSLISQQLDYRTRPCNLVELMPRLLEK